MSQVYCLLTIEVSTHGHTKVCRCVIIVATNTSARASAIVGDDVVGRSHGDVVLCERCSVIFGNEFMRVTMGKFVNNED